MCVLRFQYGCSKCLKIARQTNLIKNQILDPLLIILLSLHVSIEKIKNKEWLKGSDFNQIARQTSHILVFNSVNNLSEFFRISTAKIYHKEAITHLFDFYTTRKKNQNSSPQIPPSKSIFTSHVTGLDLGYTSLVHGHDTLLKSAHNTRQTDGQTVKSAKYMVTSKLGVRE